MARLLGKYDSKLPAFLYQELVKLVESSVTAGDFGGGKLFDRKKLEELRLQGMDFNNLPLSSAGQRAYAESLNYPMRLLSARYAAISSETKSFLETISKLLETLEKDTNLAERLLRVAGLESWVHRQPLFVNGSRFAVDLGANTGPVAISVPNSDPATGIVNKNKCQTVSFSYKGDPIRRHLDTMTAITSDLSVKRVKPIDIQWHYEKDESEMEYVQGDNWTRISFIYPEPIIDFGPPSVETLAPSNTDAKECFIITGSSNIDNLTVFVKTLFVPRTRSTTVTATADLLLSQYRINRNEIYLHSPDGSQFYEEGIDYTIDQLNLIQPAESMLGQQVVAVFQEYYPGYQCSVNEVNWSPTILFDSENPYPDGEADFNPIDVVDEAFPIQDESTSSVGLRIRMIKIPEHEYLIKIQSSGVVLSASKKATLEVSFEQLRMLNGLTIRSVSQYPLRISRIYDAISYGGQITKSIFSSSGAKDDLILDRELTIRFPKQEIQRLFIEMQQENYTYKEHLLDSADAMRNELLEGVLPPEETKANTTPRKITGVQYEMSVQDIYGVDLEFKLPTVAVFGPFTTDFAPTVLRLDDQHTGTIDYYFVDKPVDKQNQELTSVYELLDANAANGVPIYPGLPAVYKQPAEEVSKISFFIKTVFRTPDSVLERFVFQAS